MKPTLISGIQPTGRLHIGNYLGALKNFVDLQNSGKYKCYFFIADLHSLTESYKPKEKQKQIIELVADYLAAGLNPIQSTIFLQSLVPAHSALAWLLSTVAPLGDMHRMTQFKDKSEHDPKNINLGLLSYPALQAADILLYNTTNVPVGSDQLQHLELTRTLARKFNARFGKTFVEPTHIITEGQRIMSLDNPSKKMSKSRPQGCLFVDDSPTEIEAKIRRAVTDSGSTIEWDPKNKPAISNMLQIYSSLSGERNLRELELQFNNDSYSAFKQKLTRLIVNHFADFRKKKVALMKKKPALVATLKKGSAIAAKQAHKKLNEVKEKMGIMLH